MSLLETVLGERLLAILRGVPPSHAPNLVGALADGGIHTVEVALSGPEGLAGLRALRGNLPPGVRLGAGTVITRQLAEQAHDAGATFLVTPHVVPDVSNFGREFGLPVISGAFTATEIALARSLGSEIVKVFPAGTAGPEYFRALAQPYPEARLMAVGGVNAVNLAAFLDAGAVAAGIGGALTSLEWSRPDFESARERAATLVEIASQHKPRS